MLASMRFTWLAGVGLTCVLGCSSESSNPEASGGSGAICVPGSTQGCVGPGSCAGGQTCAKDGQSWEACLCGAGGAGGTSGGGGTSGSGGATGGTGGGSAAIGYVLYETGTAAFVRSVNLATGQTVLKGPGLTSPLQGAGARALVADELNALRILWQDSAHNARIQTLARETLSETATSNVLTHPTHSIAYAYAHRSSEGTLIWGDGKGNFLSSKLDASDKALNAEAVLSAPSAGFLPTAAAYDTGGTLHVLWASGITGTAVLVAGEGANLPDTNSLLYRSISFETGRVRIGLADVGSPTKAEVCTFSEVVDFISKPTASGWGVGQCANVFEASWNYRGFARGP